MDAELLQLSYNAIGSFTFGIWPFENGQKTFGSLRLRFDKYLIRLKTASRSAFTLHQMTRDTISFSVVIQF